MVTLTLGSRWQEKVEEVANLKLEREELLSAADEAKHDRQMKGIATSSRMWPSIIH